MDDTAALKYTTLKLFYYSIMVFLIAFIFWQILTPAQDLYDNFSLGLILFFLFCLFTFLAWKTQSHSIFRSLFFWPASLFWLILFMFMLNSYPSIEDITYQNKTVYILTYNKDFLEPQYHDFQVAKWTWNALPKVSGLSDGDGDLHFVYDEERKTMMVVSTFPRGKNLVFIDNGISHQDFEGYTETKFENRLYFVSMNCNWKEDSHSCDPYTYSIAKCNLELTSCETLPFQYKNSYAIPYLEIDEENSELNFILEFTEWSSNQVEPTYTQVKIYTYGAHPRCYVEGCTILNTP